jgi:hypothetical protein
MKIEQNKKLSYIPLISQNVDNHSNLAYKVAEPLEAMNSFSYIVGSAGSGKSSLFLALLCSHPTKKKPLEPRFYYKYFDKIYLCSNSLASLPLSKLNLNEHRVHNKFSDEILKDIIETEREDEENNNCLLVLDDCIKQLKKNSDELCKVILNRRHILTNPEGEGCAGLSVFILSQRYNELPLTFRCNTSSIYLFRTDNKKELDNIREELMSDLTKEQQNKVLKLAWNDRYSFLLIKNNKPTSERYFQRFNKIIINELDENDEGITVEKD